MNRLDFIKSAAALLSVPFLAMAPVIATGAEPDPPRGKRKPQAPRTVFVSPGIYIRDLSPVHPALSNTWRSPSHELTVELIGANNPRA